MRPETIERIRHSYDIFNERGTFDEAFFRDDDFFHPEIEWHNASEFPGADVHRGVGAVVADLAAQGEAWESRSVDVLEIDDADDKVAVLVRLSMRGKASGLPVQLEVTHLWTFEDGRVRRIEVFVDRKKALKAAGL